MLCFKLLATMCNIGVLVLLCVSIITPCVFASGHSNSSQLTEGTSGINRTERALLFNVFRFANQPCVSENSDRNGICYTRAECRNLGGRRGGVCASGFGVCCAVNFACGSTSRLNNIVFTNPNFPAQYSTPQTTCIMNVRRSTNDTVQIRIEFDDVVLAQPNAEGKCETDFLTVQGGASPNVPRLCGDLSRQHVYVNFMPNNINNNNNNDNIIITVSIGDDKTIDRRWNINVIQLAENRRRNQFRILRKPDDSAIAPTGCLQFYTGITGSVQSFNYGTTMSTVEDEASGQAGTREMQDLSYGICVETEPGYCGIMWSPNTTSDRQPFTISSLADNTPLPSDAAPGLPMFGSDCTTDYILVPGGTYIDTTISPPSTTPTSADRFCGTRLLPVTTRVQPFVLTVITNAMEADDIDFANRGFSLDYKQIAC